MPTFHLRTDCCEGCLGRDGCRVVVCPRCRRHSYRDDWEVRDVSERASDGTLAICPQCAAVVESYDSVEGDARLLCRLEVLAAAALEAEAAEPRRRVTRRERRAKQQKLLLATES